jgi:hypothetical protein
MAGTQKLEEGAQALNKAVEDKAVEEPEALPVDEELRRAAAALDADKLDKATMIVSGKRVDKSPEGAKVDQPKDQADQRGGPEGNKEDRGSGGDDPDKDDEPDEEMPDDERQDKSEAEARDEFFRSLSENEEVSPLLEASEALQGLAVEIGKAEGRRAAEIRTLQKSVAKLAGRLEQVAGVVGLIAKSQAILHKGVGDLGRPVKLPMPGMMFDPREGGGRQNGKDTLSKGEIVDALTRAMYDGKLDRNDGSGILAKLDSNPQAAIAAIPDEVAKSYGIPKDALQKSKG